MRHCHRTTAHRNFQSFDLNAHTDNYLTCVCAFTATERLHTEPSQASTLHILHKPMRAHELYSPVCVRFSATEQFAGRCWISISRRSARSRCPTRTCTPASSAGNTSKVGGGCLSARKCCVCMCMYLWGWVWVCGWAGGWVGTRVYVCVCVCVCVHVSVRARACVGVYVYVRACVASVCASLRHCWWGMQACKVFCAYSHTHSRMRCLAQTHTHTHTHTRTHTHTHNTGRGQHTHAHTHAVTSNHHVFINLGTKKVCAPHLRVLCPWSGDSQAQSPPPLPTLSPPSFPRPLFS